MPEARCAACGNILENGRCTRCEANRFTRQRRWRTGDRGGKRPERRIRRRTLHDVLDGTWRNVTHRLTIHIDTEMGTYRSTHHGRKDTSHAWRFDREGERFISFYKDDMLIKATVTDAGFLVMSARGRDIAFSYVVDDEHYRTCPHCYGKSPIEHMDCRVCGVLFEQSAEANR